MTRPLRPLGLLTLLIGLALGPLGCSPSLDTTYGRVRGSSINGTGVLAELFRGAGHEVRVAVRLNDRVAEEADTVVRFSPYPGPPDEQEAAWYTDWLDRSPDHRLVYVCRDYDSEAEYWTSVLDQIPEASGEAEDLVGRRDRIRELRDEARTWAADLPRPADDPADPLEWFEVDTGSPVATCLRLSGPWAEGIDAGQASLTRHQTLVPTTEYENVLLEGDDRPLVMDWFMRNESMTLIVANASFLLNAAMVNPARRPLAMEVVRWAGGSPRRVIFVEGTQLLGSSEGPPSPFELVRRLPTLAWILAHFAVLGLVASLARAVILGRPRPMPPSGAERPRAHAEALGALLAKTRDERAARSLLESYARWRHGPGQDHRS